MQRNTIYLIFALTPIFLGTLIFVGMNIYVSVKVKRRIRELERNAVMSSPVGFDWQAWHEEMGECKEWLYHGWPEPGGIYQGKIIGGYGFHYVRRKRRVRF
jgi:hypothetical protein